MKSGQAFKPTLPNVCDFMDMIPLDRFHTIEGGLSRQLIGLGNRSKQPNQSIDVCERKQPPVKATVTVNSLTTLQIIDWTRK